MSGSFKTSCEGSAEGRSYSNLLRTQIRPEVFFSSSPSACGLAAPRPVQSGTQQERPETGPTQRQSSAAPGEGSLFMQGVWKTKKKARLTCHDKVGNTLS